MTKQFKTPIFCLVLGVFTMLAFSSCKKRCPIDSCQTKMVHTHNGNEFRGMPWWRKQNPKTGELDPVLNRDGKKY